MERRFRVRLAQLLDDAHVPATLLRGVLPRLQTFLQPFLDALQTPQQQTNARHYVQGLLSDLGSKDVESIAYLHDRQRQGLQKFIGQTDWDHQPLLTELARQVGTELGHDDAVLVFDPCKHDYLLSNAPLTTEVSEFARVFKAQHRIEECLRRAKGEAGLGDYQVRTWSGWHHHQTLSLLASWFLTEETRRGKKADAGVDGAAGGGVAGVFAERAIGVSSSVTESPADVSSFASQRGGTSVSLATT